MSKEIVITRNGEGEALKATGGRVRFICPAEKTNKTWSLMEATLPRDAGPPPHDHPWDESYYIIEGDVNFTLGDKTMRVTTGDFIYAPAGVLHGFKGASDKPARILVFDAPAHAEDFFRDMDREVKEFPRDAAKIPEIGLRHQIRFVLK